MYFNQRGEPAKPDRGDKGHKGVRVLKPQGVVKVGHIIQRHVARIVLVVLVGVESRLLLARTGKGNSLFVVFDVYLLLILDDENRCLNPRQGNDHVSQESCFQGFLFHPLESLGNADAL